MLSLQLRTRVFRGRRLKNLVVFTLIAGSIYLMFQVLSMEMMPNSPATRNKMLRRKTIKMDKSPCLSKNCSAINNNVEDDQSDLVLWKEKLKSKMNVIRQEQEKLQNLLKNDFSITVQPKTETKPKEINNHVKSELFKVVGVHREDIHLYKPDKNNMFKCLSSDLKIPFKNVNDDYCDCPDHSDEPGTSACPNSRFYCTFQLSLAKSSAKWIPSGSVGDSICDCCDGSDEWQRYKDTKNPKEDIYSKLQVYHTPCIDRCTELRKKKQEEEEIRILAASSRMDYVKKGKSAPPGKDYGPQNVFFPLSEKCFTYNTKEYQYEVCPFKEVKQINHNSNSVVTGTDFKWLSRTPYDFSIEMIGGDGRNCPDSERSTIIQWECGLTDSVLKITENERCRYKVLMTSPAAC